MSVAVFGWCFVIGVFGLRLVVWRFGTGTGESMIRHGTKDVSDVCLLGGVVGSFCNAPKHLYHCFKGA